MKTFLSDKSRKLRKLIKNLAAKTHLLDSVEAGAQYCCSCFFHPLRKEFQKQKFSLAHQPADDFVKSQWQRHSRSTSWLIYRWCLAIYFCAAVSDTMVQLFYDGKWFIYLTAWGFFLCMYSCVYGAVLASIYYWRPHKFVVKSWVLKIYWASHCTTIVLATMITFVYWVLLYPHDNTGVPLVYNLLGHASNSILMVLDLMLVAFPTHLLHVIYPLGLSLLYAIFSLIYYFAGGVDIEGDRYIYIILDWTDPGWAILTIIAVIVLMIIMSFLLFGLYKLRCYIYRKMHHSMVELKTLVI